MIIFVHVFSTLSICQGHCVMLILTNVLPIPAITWVSVRTGPGVSRVTVPWGYKGRGARLTRITVRAAPAGTRRRVWTMSMDSRMLFFCLRYHYMFSLEATHVNLQSLADFHNYFIRRKFNPKHFMQIFTYFRQNNKDC